MKKLECSQIAKFICFKLILSARTSVVWQNNLGAIFLLKPYVGAKPSFSFLKKHFSWTWKFWLQIYFDAKFQKCNGRPLLNSQESFLYFFFSCFCLHFASNVDSNSGWVQARRYFISQSWFLNFVFLPKYWFCLPKFYYFFLFFRNFSSLFAKFSFFFSKFSFLFLTFSFFFLKIFFFFLKIFFFFLNIFFFRKILFLFRKISFFLQHILCFYYFLKNFSFFKKFYFFFCKNLFFICIIFFDNFCNFIFLSKCYVF